jgi:hypothetical protein
MGKGNPRLWEPWRDATFVICAILTLFIVLGDRLYAPLYAARIAAHNSPILTVENFTDFIKFWFLAHMFEITWQAYDGFYWQVPGRLAWGLLVYLFGAPALWAYAQSPTRRRRLQLELSAPSNGV